LANFIIHERRKAQYVRTFCVHTYIHTYIRTCIRDAELDKNLAEIFAINIKIIEVKEDKNINRFDIDYLSTYRFN